MKFNPDPKRKFTFGAYFRSVCHPRLLQSLLYLMVLAAPIALHAQSYSLVPVGSSSQISGPYYELTPDAASEVGAVWNTSSINLDNSFDYTFYFNFGTKDANGADGIVFVLETQTDPGTSGVSSLMGGMGYGIGYGTTPLTSGISPSLAVEFDTWWNGSSTVNYDLGTGTYHTITNPNESDEIDHIDIVKNGAMKGNSLMPGGDPIQASANSVNIEDGLCHKVEIKWIPYGTGIQTGTNEALCSLEVYFDGNLRQRINKDIRSVFSTSYNAVWWGITSATQTGTNEQYITYLNAGDGTNKDLYVCKGSSIQLGTTLQSGTGLSYSWTGPNGFTSTQKSPTITPTVSGLYTVTMKHNMFGCANVTASVYVHVDDPVITLSSPLAVCNGNSITLHPQISGIAGDEQVTYSWTSVPSSSIPAVKEPTVTPTGPSTTYTVTASVAVSNGHYCTATASVTVNVEDLSVTIDPVPVQCAGSSITLNPNVSGQVDPNEPVIYNWTSSPSSNIPTVKNPTVIPVAPNTTYYLTVTSAVAAGQNCTASASVTVNVENLSVTIDPVPVQCLGSSVVLNPHISGQVDPNEAVTYSWTSLPASTIPSVKNPTVTPLANTTYYLTVTSTASPNQHCTASANVAVTVQDLELTMPADPTTCVEIGVPLNTSVTGANAANLVYSWSPASGLSCTNCPNPMANPAVTTTYTLTVTDNTTNCTTSRTVTVNIVPSPDFTMCNTVINICPGEIATLTAIPVTGFPTDAVLTWTSNKGPSDHSISDPHSDPTSVNPTSTTTYILTVSMPNGCSKSHSVTVVVGATATFEKTYQHIIHDPSGDIQVDNNVNSLTRSEGCGFALAGSEGTENTDKLNPNVYLHNMSIIRTDEVGGINWAKLYLRNDVGNESHEGWFNYIAKTYPPLHPSFCPNTTPDGYIVIGAASTPAHCPHFDMEMVHTDLDGSIAHSAAYGSTISCEIGNFVIPTQDQGYMAVGNTRSFVNTGAALTGFLVKTDGDLNAAWGAAFEGNGDIDRVIQLSNGDFLLFGITDADDNVTHTGLNIMVVRMDNTGSVIWAKKYYPSGLIPSPDINQQVEGKEATVTVKDVSTLADGSFLIFGNTTTTAGYGGIDGYLLDIDENGSLQWSKVIGTPNNEQAGNLKIDKGGNNVYYFSTKNATDYQVCIATSPPIPAMINFQEQWNTTPQNDITGGLEVMPDGGYAFGFSDAQPDGMRSDLNFARTDNVGHTGCELNSSVSVKDIKTITYNIGLTGFITSLTAEQVSIAYDNLDVSDLPIETSKLCPVNIICDGGDGGGTSTTLTHNPDFSVVLPCGSTYFSSDMTVSCSPGALPGPGSYTLAPDAAMVDPGWMGSDHSGNGSSIFIGSGATITDMRAWYETVPVDKDEKYILCMWARNICPNCPVLPNIKVTTGGLAGPKLAEADNINPSDGWINITGVYTADATKMLELDVVIPHAGGSGNNFALDDINFYHFSVSGLNPFVSVIDETKPEESEETSNLYPNPVKRGNNIILDYMAANNEKADISIIDATGKIVMHLSKNFQSGDNAFGFQTGGLAEGVYQLRILINNKVVTKRFAVVQ